MNTPPNKAKTEAFHSHKQSSLFLKMISKFS